MANKAAVEKNERRKRLVKKYSSKRARLKAIIKNPNSTPEEIMNAQFAMQKLPRNSAPIRVRNRCGITGRPRAYYRRFGMSRIALRQLGSLGLIPGVTKSSW